jgi:signal transduction histidine kinase
MSGRVLEPSLPSSYRGPYKEIAIYVRDLLKCDYAFIAVPENDSIRIQGFVGPEDEKSDVVAATLVSRLTGWGPIVVDDAQLIAVPLASGDDVVGVLVGYSPKSGTFTADDLEKLMAYAPVGACVLASSVVDETSGRRRLFSDEQLLHFSRLVTIGELSACIAHDVNNRLTLVRGHLDLFDEALPDDHPLRMNFEVIDRATRRIEEMASRMLEFSKKRPRCTSRCEVEDLVWEALRLVQPYTRSNGVDVQVHLDEQLPTLEVDRGEVVQAVVNLVQNAIDAMAKADRRVLSITGTVDDNQIRVVISDTGVGIQPDHISKIFEPFFTTKGEPGTGLGLYITNQVIEEHHGSIQVESSTRGTSFVISLPLGC